MRIQRYHIIILFVIIFFSSCGIMKKNNCDCPDFTSDVKLSNSAES